MPKASRARTTEPERSYTVPQVAKSVGVDVKTVRRWITTGQLTAWRLDNEQYKIDQSALQAFKDARRVVLKGAK